MVKYRRRQQQQIERTFRGTSVKIKPNQQATKTFHQVEMTPLIASNEHNQYDNNNNNNNTRRGRRKRKMREAAKILRNANVNSCKLSGVSGLNSNVTFVILGIVLVALNCLINSHNCDTTASNQLAQKSTRQPLATKLSSNQLGQFVRSAHQQQKTTLTPFDGKNKNNQHQSTSGAKYQKSNHKLQHKIPSPGATNRPKSATKSHREQDLLTLSESIERQHFSQYNNKPSPLQSLAQLKSSRPTKFDSDNGQHWRILTAHEPLKKSSPVVVVGEEKKQHQVSPSNHNKADEGMRQIMMMHEHAVGYQQQPASSAGQKNDDQKKLDSSKSKHGNTVVSKVLSYLAPPSSPLPPPSTTPNEAQQSSSTQNELSLFSMPILNPFSARANGHQAAKPSNLMRDLSKKLFLGQQSATTASTTSTSPLVDLLAESSSNILVPSEPSTNQTTPNSSTESGGGGGTRSGRYIYTPMQALSNELKAALETIRQLYLKEPLKNVLTMTQLPILSSATASTAPSDLESGGKQWLANKMAAQQVIGNRSVLALDDILRYAYILGTGVRRKRDPLKVLGTTPAMTFLNQRYNLFSQRAIKSASLSQPTPASKSTTSPMDLDTRSSQPQKQQQSQPFTGLVHGRFNSLLLGNKNAKPRGVMWDMATDPSLAVTVFHLLERASVALPLGFLLMPFVQMIRNPLNGFFLGRILPARASHRSVDYEELAKRLDMVDKILSRALRQTHREGR